MVGEAPQTPVGETGLQVTRVRGRSELAPHLEGWTALAAGKPMRSPEWLLCWWDCYAAPGDELWVLLFHDADGALVGLAPLYLRAQGRQKTLCLLGSGAVGTNHTTWLAAPGMERAIGAAVGRTLIERQSEWSALHFDWIDSDDAALTATLALLSERGRLVRRAAHQHSSWQIALPKTWDEFLGMLSRSHRKRCRKWERLFLETGRVRMHRVTDADGLERGFEVLLRLHAARWGDRKHPLGCFSDDRFLSFHRAVARQLLGQGRLFLFWLELDGAPIAVEYQFVDQDTVYSYLAGMAPEVTEFPPGNLSIMVTIRYAIAHGMTTFDLSRGNQPYKANWRATAVRAEEVRVWPDRLGSRLAAARWCARKGWERRRLQAARWVKGRVPEGLVARWRDAVYLLTGNRFGPRKRDDLQRSEAEE